jgi:hypothetical protein
VMATAGLHRRGEVVFADPGSLGVRAVRR